MKLAIFPVPNAESKSLPQKGDPGSFGENRGDRIHCGTDIYAPFGSDVLAVESAEVIDMGVFTSPDIIPYWNKTYFIAAKSGEFIIIYAELGEVFVNKGETIERKQRIGSVGLVLNAEKIGNDAPDYIRSLKHNRHQSMLHLEIRKVPYLHIDNYLAGNYFGAHLPECFVEGEW